MDLGEVKPWTRAAGADPGSDRETAKGRAWVEREIRWLVAEFGEEAVRREFMVPTPEFLPTGLTGPDGQERIREFVERVAAVMGARTDLLDLRFFRAAAPDAGGGGGKALTVGRYHRTGGRDVIELDLDSADRPEELAAIIAHELGHLLLRRYSPLADREPLTDLVTVVLGMGVFGANAANTFATARRGFSVLPSGDLTSRMLNGAAHHDGSHHLGYLTPDQFGHALVCCARLRGEHDPSWARHLEPGVRAVVKRGLAGPGPSGS
ncbi:hypothetical protein ACFQ6N_19495 [Kitasatospora sp. NPDC056446]|uniref:hypothetical protein n=1 Tax=Kitasatospora sp. NPDC056446 TaxID=3345819 RepID=UPI0036C63C24